jgi:3',5'-cyclic AMP phosphodiesterase CpdA
MANHTVTLGRRAFLRHGTLYLTAAGLGLTGASASVAQDGPKPGLRIGLVTDLHYADKPSVGSRHYRETLAKFAEAADHVKHDKPAFVVELGDLIDTADSVAVGLGYLDRINRAFSAISDSRYYVLGNHCVNTLTKEEFLGAVGQKRSYYSFDSGSLHFIVLDSCFRNDGKPYGRKNSHWADANIPQEQVQWLAADLAGTLSKVVVFAHQRLDVAARESVKNAAEVRQTLQNSGKVIAVFQGHSHKNDYQDIAGIHYCTMLAMVEGSGAENNGYSIADIGPSGAIRITGFRKQKSYVWSAQS